MSETSPPAPFEPDAAPASTPVPRQPTAPPGQLTKATDHAPRPGFRSPPNKNSKAQKKRK